MYQSSPRMSPSCYLSKCRAASFIKGIPLAKNFFYMYVDFNVLVVVQGMQLDTVLAWQHSLISCDS